jgi:hypothetical protein
MTFNPHPISMSWKMNTFQFPSHLFTNQSTQSANVDVSSTVITTMQVVQQKGRGRRGGRYVVVAPLLLNHSITHHHDLHQITSVIPRLQSFSVNSS